MKKIVVLVSLLICGISFAASHDVYVNGANTSGNEDGQSWATAFKSFHNLNDSISSWTPTDTYQIWIAQGDYVITDNIEFSPVDAGGDSVNVWLRGGCDGTETSVEQWDPKGHTVTLTASFTGDIVRLYNDTANSTLEFIVFKNFDRPAFHGEGITTVRNCVFDNCYCGLYLGNGEIHSSVFKGCGRGTPSLVPPSPPAFPINQGAFVCNGIVSVYNCDFISNQKSGSEYGIIYRGIPVLGSYLFQYPEGPIVINSIFWANDMDESPVESPLTMNEYAHLRDSWKNNVLTSGSIQTDMVYYSEGTYGSTMIVKEPSFAIGNLSWWWTEALPYSLSRTTPDGVTNSCRDTGTDEALIKYDLYGNTDPDSGFRLFGNHIDIGASEYFYTSVDFSGNPRSGTSSPKELVELSADTIHIDTNLISFIQPWWNTDIEVFFSPTYGSTLPIPLDKNVRYWLRATSNGYELYQNGKYGTASAQQVDLTSIGTGSMIAGSGVTYYAEDLLIGDNFNVDTDTVKLIRGYWGNTGEISFESTNAGLLPGNVSSGKRYFLSNQTPVSFFWTLSDYFDPNNVYTVGYEFGNAPDPLPIVTFMEFVGEIITDSNIDYSGNTIKLQAGGVSTIDHWDNDMKIRFRTNGYFPDITIGADYWLADKSEVEGGVLFIVRDAPGGGGNLLDFQYDVGSLCVYLAEGEPVPGKEPLTPLTEQWSPFDIDKPSSVSYNGIALRDEGWNNISIAVVSGDNGSYDPFPNTLTKITNSGVFIDSYNLSTSIGGSLVDITSGGSGTCRAVYRNTPVSLFVNFIDKTTVSSGHQVIGWKWDFNGDGIVDNTDQNPSFLYATEGVYNVKLTVLVHPDSGLDYEDSVIKNEYVVVSRSGVLLDADFTSDVRCGVAPLDVKFIDNTNSSETTLSYLWDFGDGSTSTDPSPTHQYVNPGYYDVTYTVSYMGERSVRSKKGYVFVPTVLNPRFSADYVVRVAPDYDVHLYDESYVLNYFTDLTPAIINAWEWNIYDPEGNVCKTAYTTDVSFGEGDFNGYGKYGVKLKVTTDDSQVAETPIIDSFEILPPVKIGFSMSNNFIRPGEEIYLQNDSLVRTTSDKFLPQTIKYEIWKSGGSVLELLASWDMVDKLTGFNVLTEEGTYTVKLTVTGLFNGSTSGSMSKEEEGAIVIGEGFNTSLNATPRLGVVPLKIDFKDNSFFGSINVPKTWFWEYGDGGANLWRDLDKLENTPDRPISLSVVPVYEMHGPSNNWGENKQLYSHMGNRTGTYSFEGTYADNGVRSPVSFNEENAGELPPLASLSYDNGNHVFSPSYWYKSPGSYTVSLTSNSNKITKSNFVEVVPPVEVDFSTRGKIGDMPLHVEFIPNLVRYNFEYPVSYEWEFEGGNPATSTEENPVVTYDMNDNFFHLYYVSHLNVSLKVKIGNWETKVIKQGYVEVFPPVLGKVSWQILSSEGTPPDDTYLVRLNPQLFLTRPYDRVIQFSYGCGEYFSKHALSGNIDTGEVSHTYPAGWAMPALNVKLQSQNKLYSIIPATYYDPPILNDLTSQIRCGSSIELKTYYYPKQGYAPLKVNAIFNAFAPFGNEITKMMSLFVDEAPKTEIRSWVKGESNRRAFMRQSYTFENPGDFQVAFMAQTSTGQPVISLDNIRVYDSENPKADYCVVSPSRDGDKPSKGIVPYQVKFFDKSTVGGSTIEKWSWDFGDGGSSVEQNPVHTYFKDGSYSVILTVTTKNGKTDTKIRDGIIRAMVLPTAAFEYEFVPNTFLGSATTFLVNRHNSSGTEDGKSWDTGFTTIQEAVDAASSVGGGDVWISEGWYGLESNILHSSYGYPSVGGDLPGNYGDESNHPFVSNSCGEYKYSVVVLPDGVNLYGGFTTEDNSILDRDPKKNIVVVSGSYSQLHNPMYESNVDAVIEVRGTSTIDGLMIVGGNARGRFFDSDEAGFGCYEQLGFGGGIHAKEANLTVNNCTFAFNSAVWGGGAISAQKSVTKITGCSFFGNVSCSGSSVMSFDPTATSSDNESILTIQDSSFLRNYSGASFAFGQIKDTPLNERDGAAGFGYVQLPYRSMSVRTEHPVLVPTSGTIADDNRVNWGNVVILNVSGNGSYEGMHGSVYMLDVSKRAEIKFKKYGGEGQDPIECVIEPVAYCIENESGSRVFLPNPIELCDGIIMFELDKASMEVFINSFLPVTSTQQNLNSTISFGEYVSVDGTSPSLEGPPDFSLTTTFSLGGDSSGKKSFLEYSSGKKIRLDYINNQVIPVKGTPSVDEGLNFFDIYGDFSKVVDGTIDIISVRICDSTTKAPGDSSYMSAPGYVVLSDKTLRVDIPTYIKEFNYALLSNSVCYKTLGYTVYVGYNDGYGTTVYSNGIFVSFYDPDVSGGVFSHTTPMGTVWFEGTQGSITNCTFSDNFSVGGGSIYSEDNLTVQSSLFENNKSGLGGAVSLVLSNSALGEASVSFDGCRFIGNEVYGSYGGAIASILKPVSLETNEFLPFLSPSNPFSFEHVASSLNNNIEVRNCIFSGNKSGSSGSAIAIGDDTKFSLLHSSLFDNVAKNDVTVTTDSGYRSGNNQIALGDISSYEVLNSIVWTRDVENKLSIAYQGQDLTLKDSVVCGFVANQIGISNTVSGVVTDDPTTVGGYPPYGFKLKDEDGNYVDLKKEGHILSEDLLLYGDTFSTESDYISLLRPEWRANNFVSIYRTDSEGEDIPSNLSGRETLVNRGEGGVQLSKEGGGFNPSAEAPYEATMNPEQKFYMSDPVPLLYTIKDSSTGDTIDFTDYGDLNSDTNHAGYFFPIIGSMPFWEHDGAFGRNPDNNRVQNGDFEVGDPPAYWSLEQSSPGHSQITWGINTGYPHFGSGAVSLEIGDDALPCDGYIYQDVPLDYILSGKTYSFHCYSRSYSGSGFADQRIEVVTNEGTESVSLPVTSSYTPVTGTFSLASTPTSVQIRIYPGTTDSTTILVDDVGINYYEVGSAPNIDTVNNRITFSNPESLDAGRFLHEDDWITFDTSDAILGIEAGKVYEIVDYVDPSYKLKDHETGSYVDLGDTFDDKYVSNVYVKRETAYSLELDPISDSVRFYEDMSPYPFNTSPSKNVFYYVYLGTSPTGLTENTFYDLTETEVGTGRMYHVSPFVTNTPIIDISSYGYGNADLAEHLEEISIDTDVVPEKDAIHYDVLADPTLPYPGLFGDYCFAINSVDNPEYELPAGILADNYFYYSYLEFMDSGKKSRTFIRYNPYTTIFDISGYGKGYMYVGKYTDALNPVMYYNSGDLYTVDYDSIEIKDTVFGYSKTFSYEVGYPVIFKFYGAVNNITGIEGGELYWIAKKAWWKSKRTVRDRETTTLSPLNFVKSGNHGLFNVLTFTGSTLWTNCIDMDVGGDTSVDYIPIRSNLAGFGFKDLEVGDEVILTEYLAYGNHVNYIKTGGNGLSGGTGVDPDGGYPDGTYQYFVIHSFADESYESPPPNPTDPVKYVRLALASDPSTPIQIYGDPGVFPAHPVSTFLKTHQLELPQQVSQEYASGINGMVYHPYGLAFASTYHVYYKVEGDIPTYFTYGVNRVYGNTGAITDNNAKNTYIYELIKRKTETPDPTDYVDIGGTSGSAYVFYGGGEDYRVKLGTKVDTENDTIVLTHPPSEIDSIRVFLKYGIGTYPTGIDSVKRYDLWYEPYYPTESGEYAYKLVDGDFRDPLLKAENIVDIKTSGRGTLVVGKVIDRDVPLVPDVLTTSDTEYTSLMNNSVRLRDSQNRTLYHCVYDYHNWISGESVKFILPNDPDQSRVVTPIFNNGSGPQSIENGYVFELGDRVGSNGRYTLTYNDALALFQTSGSGYIDYSTEYPDGVALPNRMFAFCPQETISDITSVVDLDSSTLSLTKSLWTLKENATASEKEVIVVFTGDMPAPIEIDRAYVLSFSDDPEDESKYLASVKEITPGNVSSIFGGREFAFEEDVIFTDSGSGSCSVWVARGIVGLGSHVSTDFDYIFSESPSLEDGGPYYLFPRGPVTDVSYPYLVSEEDPTTRNQIRVGLVGDISTSIKLGAGGWYGTEVVYGDIKICDDRWNVGDEVSFYPGEGSQQVVELPIGKTFKISKVEDKVESPFHVINLISMSDGSQVFPQSTYEGRLTMYRVSRVNEEIPLESSYFNLQRGTVRLLNPNWQVGDTINVTSEYWSRYPYPLFEGRSYRIDSILPGSIYGEVGLYDLLSGSSTSFMDFARLILQMKGKASFNQTSVANIFSYPGSSTTELSESFRDDISDISSIDLTNDKIHLIRQDWKDDDEIYFNSQTQYSKDLVSNTPVDPVAIPAQTGGKPVSLELQFEKIFPERIRGVISNRRCKLTAVPGQTIYAGEILLVWGDHLARAYLGRTDAQGIEGSIGDLLLEIKENTTIKDMVIAPQRGRVMMACDDEAYPLKVFKLPPLGNTFAYGNPLPGKVVNNIIAVESDLQTILDTIILTDAYLNGESGIYYVDNGQQPDRPYINEDYDFVPPSEVDGFVPLAIKSYSPTYTLDTGVVNLLFVLYSNNKVVCYDVFNKAGSTITPITNGVFEYEGEGNPTLQYLNLRDEGDTTTAKVRFFAGSPEGILFTGGVSVDVATGDVTVESATHDAQYLGKYSIPIGSIWSQFRLDNGDYATDLISKRGFFSKKEGGTNWPSGDIRFEQRFGVDGHCTAADSCFESPYILIGFSGYGSSSFNYPNYGWFKVYKNPTAGLIYNGTPILPDSDSSVDLERAGGVVYGKPGNFTPPLGIEVGTKYKLSDKTTSESTIDSRLTTDSPAIDIGSNVGLRRDVQGQPRPFGEGYDAGAYEYSSESTEEPGSLKGSMYTIEASIDGLRSLTEVSLSSGNITGRVGNLTQDGSLIISHTGQLFLISGNWSSDGAFLGGPYSLYRVNPKDATLYLVGKLSFDTIYCAQFAANNALCLIAKETSSSTTTLYAASTLDASIVQIASTTDFGTLVPSEIRFNSFVIQPPSDGVMGLNTVYKSFYLTTPGKIWEGSLLNDGPTAKKMTFSLYGLFRNEIYSLAIDEDEKLFGCGAPGDRSIYELVRAPEYIETRRAASFSDYLSFDETKSIQAISIGEAGATVISNYEFPIQFMDRSVSRSSTIRNWLWDFGDKSMSSLQNPIHSYPWVGTFNVTLGVMNDVGIDVTSKIIPIGTASGSNIFVWDHYVPSPWDPYMLKVVSVKKYGRASEIHPYVENVGSGSILVVPEGSGRFYHISENSYLVENSAKVVAQGGGSFTFDYMRDLSLEDIPANHYTTNELVITPTEDMDFAAYFTGLGSYDPFSFTRTHPALYECEGNTTVLITVRITSNAAYPITALRLVEQLPSNESGNVSYNSKTHVDGTLSSEPDPDQTGSIEFIWDTIPSTYPIELTYLVNISSGSEGTFEFRGFAHYFIDGEERDPYGPVVTTLRDNCEITPTVRYPIQVTVAPINPSDPSIPVGKFKIESVGVVPLDPFVAPTTELTSYQGYANTVKITAVESNDCYEFTEITPGPLLEAPDLVLDSYPLTDSSAKNLTVFFEDASPVAIAQDIDVELDEDGVVSITPEMVDDGSYDPGDCGGIVSMTVDVTSVDCSSGATVNGILTVKDQSNNEDSDGFVVTVTDPIDPVLTLVSTYTATLNSSSVTVTPDDLIDTIDDNCIGFTKQIKKSGGSYGSSVSYTCSDRGSNTVFVKVTDPFGNFDEESMSITVEEGTYSCMEAICSTDTINLTADPTTVTFAMVDDGSYGFSPGSYDISPSTVDCGDKGNDVEITLTVYSGPGQTGDSKSCSAFHRITDTGNVCASGLPVAVCKNASINLNQALTTSMIDGGSYVPGGTLDALWIDVVGQSTKTWTNCSDVGTKTVTLIAVEGGNQSTCSATVQVGVSSGFAVAGVAQEITLGTNDTVTVTPDFFEAAVSGTCSGSYTWTYTLSQSTFTCADVTGVGTYKNVTISATAPGGITAIPITVANTVIDPDGSCLPFKLKVTITDDVSSRNVVDNLPTSPANHFSVYNKDNNKEKWFPTTNGTTLITLPADQRSLNTVVKFASNVVWLTGPPVSYWVTPNMINLNWTKTTSGGSTYWYAEVTGVYSGSPLYGMIQINFSVDTLGWAIGTAHETEAVFKPYVGGSVDTGLMPTGEPNYSPGALYYGEAWRGAAWALIRSSDSANSGGWIQCSNNPVYGLNGTPVTATCYPKIPGDVLPQPGGYMLWLSLPTGNWTTEVTTSTPNNAVIVHTDPNGFWWISCNTRNYTNDYPIINVRMTRRMAQIYSYVWSGQRGWVAYNGNPSNCYYYWVPYVDTSMYRVPGNVVPRVNPGGLTDVPAGYVVGPGAMIYSNHEECRGQRTNFEEWCYQDPGMTEPECGGIASNPGYWWSFGGDGWENWWLLACARYGSGRLGHPAPPGGTYFTISMFDVTWAEGICICIGCKDRTGENKCEQESLCARMSPDTYRWYSMYSWWSACGICDDYCDIGFEYWNSEWGWGSEPACMDPMCMWASMFYDGCAYMNSVYPTVYSVLDSTLPWNTNQY